MIKNGGPLDGVTVTWGLFLTLATELPWAATLPWVPALETRGLPCLPHMSDFCKAGKIKPATI